MALIKCPECGRDISDKAQSCPACGYPVISIASQQKTFSVFCMDWSSSVSYTHLTLPTNREV